MKFYLATNYGNWKAAKSLQGFLERRGHVVTSRWIARAEKTDGLREDRGEHQALDNEMAVWASRDFEDINNAHALVLLTTGRKQPGAMCELGYALGRGKLSIVVGELDHLFHRYPDVVHFATEGEFIEWTNSFNSEEIIEI